MTHEQIDALCELITEVRCLCAVAGGTAEFLIGAELPYSGTKLAEAVELVRAKLDEVSPIVYGVPV